MASTSHILTLNSGSSSIKFALYRLGEAEELVLVGRLERIGLPEGDFRCRAGSGQKLLERRLALPDHETALKVLFAWLAEQGYDRQLLAVGHRVVHGGPSYSQPVLITAAVLETLRELIPLAPDHQPSEVLAIEAVGRQYPSLPQVACFDTAFHRTMPRLAQIFALPRRFQAEGVLRYGFHGLSYQYIVEELQRLTGPAAGGRLIIAHLGNGASMAAVQDGRGVDTSMGMTPVCGLVMGQRSGDIDAGVIFYLMRRHGLTVDQVDDLLNKHSGLLGLSGISFDMEDLLARETAEPHAAEAIELFCYQARKYVGAFAAVLGGLDTLVFTAGIGEQAPPIRQRICAGLEFLGIRVASDHNATNEAVISAPDSPVTVRVIKTNEELMIARQTLGIVGGKTQVSDASQKR